MEELEEEKKVEPPLTELNEEEQEREYQRMIDKLNNTLKGQCHKIFCFWFFS